MTLEIDGQEILSDFLGSYVFFTTAPRAPVLLQCGICPAHGAFDSKLAADIGWQQNKGWSWQKERNVLPRAFETLKVIEKDLEQVRASLKLFLKRVEVMSWEPYLKAPEMQIRGTTRTRRK